MMASDRYDSMDWDPAAKFATVCLPPVPTGAAELPQFAEDQLQCAWQVYERLKAQPKEAGTLANPVVRATERVVRAAATGMDGDYPLACTYRTCFFDDEDGRRVEQYFGPLLSRKDLAAGDPAVGEGIWLALLAPRSLIELFPLAALCAACTTGDGELFERALSCGADPAGTLMEGRGGKWETYPRNALTMAVEAGHGWAVEALLEAGADPTVIQYADWPVEAKLRERRDIAAIFMARDYPPSNAGGLPGIATWEIQRDLPDGAFIAASIREGRFEAEDYPPRALRDELEGRAVLDIWVSRSGTPLGCRVVESSGHEMLDRRTCDVIMARFRFNPAADNIDKRPVTVRHAIQWRIERS